jgi:hypothetical protein
VQGIHIACKKNVLAGKVACVVEQCMAGDNSPSFAAKESWPNAPFCFHNTLPATVQAAGCGGYSLSPLNGWTV